MFLQQCHAMHFIHHRSDHILHRDNFYRHPENFHSLVNFLQNYSSETRVVVPETFIQSLRSNIKLFNGRVQEDSHEFLISLLNLLLVELENNKKEVCNDVDTFLKATERNFIANALFGLQQTIVVCGACLKNQSHILSSASLLSPWQKT